jgi:poly(glycerol-phosphate) alpha-glucosyltransferase
LKICFISHSASSSAAGIYEIEKALAYELINSHNCNIDIVAFKDTNFIESDWINTNINIFEPKFKKLFSYSNKMKNYVLSQEYDLIHLHNLWTYPSVITRDANIKNNVPSVITPNGMLDKWALNNSKYKKSLAKILFEAENLKNANLIHVNTYKEAKDIRSLGLKNPLTLIPNGIKINKNHLANVIEKRKLNFKNNKKKQLLFLGRLHPKKGIMELILAWSLLPKEITDEWNLAIVGWDQNGHGDELLNYTKSLKIQDSVKFHGSAFGKKKIEILINSNAFILPSFSEGLPIAVLEAWSYKLPVLMTEACNLADGFDYNAAVKITTNPNEISDSLRQVLSMKDNDLIKIGINGFNLVKLKYSWESAASKLHKSYEWLLSGGAIPDEILLEEF